MIARAATISLNAELSGGVPFACNYGGRRQASKSPAEADAWPDEAIEQARAGKPESQGSYSVIEMRIWSILLAR